MPNDDSEATPEKTAIDLLTNSVVYDGWEYAIGRQRSFYVRGVNSFRREYLNNASDLAGAVEAIYEYRNDYEHLYISGFNWFEPFSVRQALDGISLKNRKPLRFDKAVQTIVSCDIYLKNFYETDRSSTSSAIDTMFIEPAVFYIRDFDQKRLSAMVTDNTHLLSILRDSTDQISYDVFHDMASGFTVTRSLAEKTLASLREISKDELFGAIEFRHRNGLSGTSLKETL